MNPVDAPKPIIFLAFANDRVRSENNLRSLGEEAEQLQDRLREAENKGLCQVVPRVSATPASILKVFEDSNYKNSIAIFHYGGHAQDYTLLLETAEGKHAQVDASGLAEFLQWQKGLHLVFLNACSTKAQVEDWHKAGVSVVIATSHKIGDPVASAFAIHFYISIANGDDIATAFGKATSAVKLEHAALLRNLRPDKSDDEHFTVDFPWAIYPHPCKETTTQWNLRNASGDPLWDLPELPNIDFPDQPFLDLAPFNRKHSKVFFGRSSEIRKLYLHVCDSAKKPIIFLHGQSGVGKSSLLLSGLLPRLETKYEPIMVTLDPKVGLLRSLIVKLAGENETRSLKEVWLDQESKNKPLVVIFDQIEQIFTMSFPPGEILEFLKGLGEIFYEETGKKAKPLGKLILGFRKEYFPEMEQCFTQNSLSFEEVYLEPLTRSGIIEVILGSPSFRKNYNLTVIYDEKNKNGDMLAAMIADHLIRDRNSPIAPTLQILLTEMWKGAKARNRKEPSFDRELYGQIQGEQIHEPQFQDESIGLEAFLKRRVDKLREINKSTFDSGLALDILYFHITKLDTAAQHTRKEIYENYVDLDIRRNENLLYTLLQHCQGLYLLADPVGAQLIRDKNLISSRLAHDALAPLIRKFYSESDKPGQRARRILENRIQERKSGKKRTLLQAGDLKTVLAGRNGMRNWTEDERRLIRVSRFRRCRRQAGAFLSGIGVILLIVLGWAWVDGRSSAFVTDAQQEANTALSLFDVDPYQAITTSMDALPTSSRPRPYVAQLIFPLTQGLRANLERNYLRASTEPLIPERVALTPDKEQIVFIDEGEVEENKKLKKINIREWKVQTVAPMRDPLLLDVDQEHHNELYHYLTLAGVAWPDGQVLYDKLSEVQGDKRITCAYQRPNHPQILICTESSLWLWSHDTENLERLPLPMGMTENNEETILTTAWSQAGSRLGAVMDSKLWIWDTNTQVTNTLSSSSQIENIAFVDENCLIIQGLNSDSPRTVNLLSYKDNWKPGMIFYTGDNTPRNLIVSPNGNWLLIYGKNTGVGQVWDLEDIKKQFFCSTEASLVEKSQSELDNRSQDGQVLKSEEVESSENQIALPEIHPSQIIFDYDQIETGVWHSKEALLATGGSDGTIRIWDAKQGKTLVTLRGHVNRDGDPSIYVYGVYWLDEYRLLSYGEDGTFRIWQVLDKDGVPVCAGFDQGYPRCHDDGWMLKVHHADVTYARWLNDRTIITADKYGATARLLVSDNDISEHSILTDTRFVTDTLHGRPTAVWDPTGKFVLTYMTRTDWMERLKQAQELETHPEESELDPDGRIMRHEADIQSNHLPTIAGPIESAFWLDAGLLISRIYTDTSHIYTETILYQHADDPLTTEIFKREVDLSEQTGIIDAAAYHDKGLLAMGDRLGTVHVWDMNTETYTFTHNFDNSQETVKIGALQWNHDGNQLLIAAAREVSFWNLQNGELWRSLELKDEREDVYLAYSPNNRYVAAASGQKFIVLDVDTGALIWANRNHDEPIHGIAWSTGERWQNQISGSFLESLFDWPLTLFNRRFGFKLAYIHNTIARTDKSLSLLFNRVGNWSQEGRDRPLLLLTWAGDNTARLWDVEAQTELMRVSHSYPGTARPINVAALNADGSLLVTGDYRGDIYVWRTWQNNPEALLREAQQSIAHRME